MANQALVDLGASAKVKDCNTAALCIEAGSREEEIPIQQAAGVRVIPITVVARGYQSVGINGKQPVELIVTGNSSLTSGQITALTGVLVGTFVTSGSIKIATVRCNFEDMVGIDGLANVTGYSIAALCRGQLDVAIPQTDTQYAWGGVPPGPYSKYSGRDTIIGVIDSGIYLQHGDFKYASGATRVLKAWDMTIAGSGPGTGGAYGTEYDTSQLQSEANKAFPVLSDVLKDVIGHGTPMASIACGNGGEIGSGALRYKYVGVAPEADMIVVKLPDYPSEANIIDAVNYLFVRAGQYTPRRRAVALVTAMMNRGPHDGTATLDLALSALTGQDKLLAAPAGNVGWALVNPQYPDYGELGVATHAISTLPTAGATVKTIQCDPAGLSAGYQPLNEFVLIEGWFTGDQQYTIGVRGSGGAPAVTVGPVTATNGTDVTGTLTISANPSDFKTTTVRIKNNTQTNATGTKKKIEIYLYNDPTQTNISLGHIYVDITRTGGAEGTGVVHWYMADAIRWGNSKFWNAAYFNVSGTTSGMMSGANTIMSPGSADAAICFGSFVSRTSFPNQGGGTTNPIPATDVMKPSWFSSNGPRVGDSDTRPDITCPGEYVIASMSDAQNPAPNGSYIAPTYWHVAVGGYNVGGTSCAAAFGAGALALLLQKYGTLSVAQARAVIRTLVYQDAKTGAPPNNTSGYGRIDLASVGNTVSVDPVPPPTGGGGLPDPGTYNDPPIRRAGAPYDPIPKYLDPDGATATSTNFSGAMDAAPSTNDNVKMDVYNSSGVLVRTLDRNYATFQEEAFEWDYKISGGAGAPNGQYLLRFSYGDNAQVVSVSV